MPEEQPQPAATNTVADAGKNFFTVVFDKIKGPVLWIAAGYALCKYLDRKKAA